jgi:hypothetical protein
LCLKKNLIRLKYVILLLINYIIKFKMVMTSNFSPMFFEQPIVIFDTTQSLNATTGAFVLYGGLSINATYQSTSTSTGGFVLSGGMAVQKDVSVGGIQHIYNTTDSTSINDGALIVDGGVGIAKSLHVGGDTTILGNLFVQGTYTYVNTQTINVEDNTLVINAGPAGSGDGGVLIHRHGSDVVSGVAVTTGSNATIGYASITLPDGYSQVDDYYRGWWVKTSEGNAQVLSYSAGNLVLATAGNTISTSANTIGSFDLYNQSYMATYYAETQDEYRFAYVADVTDPDYQLDNFNNYADIRLKSLYANESVSTGSFYVSGNATIANLAVTDLLVASVSMENAELNSATIGALFVTGASILHEGITAGTINVTGDSILNGGVTAGTLYVTGASILDLGVTAGTINVTGDSILHGGITAGTLYVTGASILDLGVTAGTINVTGDSILNGGISAGTLYVTGASILDLGVTAGTINVTGDSILHGGITAGTLYVTGASILDLGITTGTINVTGDSILHGGITAGTLYVTGASILDLGVTAGTINVTGDSILHGGITAGTLYVTGASILDLGVTTGTINVTGDSILHGGITAGTLYVTGASILDLGVTTGTINVTGDSILHGGITAGTLYVTGASILDLGVTTGTINVTGDSILHGGITAGTLYVTGASILDLGVTTGTINVTGDSILHGGITTGTLYVSGATLLDIGLTAGSLNITASSWLQGGVTAGALNVTGDSILENNLTVTTGSVTVSTNDYLPLLDASSATGGSIIFNTVDVSPSLGDISRERIFTAVNNQSSPANITNFIFSNSVVRAFDAIVSVTILTSDNTNRYAYYNLKGVQKAGNWVVNSSYVGDATGFTFSITNSGQIQYTSTNIANYDSSFVSFRALTTSIHS